MAKTTMLPAQRLLAGVAFPVAVCSCSSGKNLTDTAAPLTDNAASIVRAPVGTSPVRGPDDAWVTMVEFGDFECPACVTVEPYVQQLLAEYPDDLRLVFKNYPLREIHPYALGAAVAAECAAEQGAFWPMHDILITHSDALASAHLPEYAQTVGLDVTAWQACLSTSAPAEAVNTDVVLANQIGVPGTPTFVINGLRVGQLVDLSEYEAIIDSARTTAKASGVSPSRYYDTVILSQ